MNESLAPAKEEPAESTSVSPSAFSHSLYHSGELFSSEPLLSLIERSVKRVTSVEVDVLSEEEPTTSPDGSKNLKSESTWPLVLLGNVVWGGLKVIFMLSVPCSSEKRLVVPTCSSVTASTSERDPPELVVTWVKILTKGEVVASLGAVVDAALRVVGSVTVVVEGAVVGVGVSVVGVCVVVVVVVVRTVEGKGVSFLVGGGMVGVGGLNLMME